MRAEYVIRRGDAAGGPVDPASAPYAVVDAAHELALPAPAADEVRRYRVNVRDADTGLEEASTFEAELRADADGLVNLLRPRPPTALAALPGAAPGEADIRWSYLHRRDDRYPAEFRIWLAEAPATIDTEAEPALVVTARVGQSAYRATLAGTPGAMATVAIRAANGSGDDGAETTAELTLPDAAAPAPAGGSAGPSWTA